MPYTYHRTVHFPDTDAAGVVYFANYLSICHEAYEEALAAVGINVHKFFADHGVIMPISKSSADYLRPLVCGDKLAISVAPTLLTPDTYAIDYQITRLTSPVKLAATVRTSHVCIRSATRERLALPAELAAWVKAG